MMRRLLPILCALWLLLPAAFARQSAPPKVEASALLGKSITAVEETLGRPRHVDGRQRYYKVEGFVRVVVTTASPGEKVRALTFQFPHGALKGEAEARTKVGLGDAPLPEGWRVSWIAPTAAEHDDLVLMYTPGASASLSSATPAAPAESYILTRHFKERMRERGVSEAAALDVLRNGQRFYDPKYDNEVRWKDGVYIALGNDGALITVIRGPINRHWKPK